MRSSFLIFLLFFSFLSRGYPEETSMKNEVKASKEASSINTEKPAISAPQQGSQTIKKNWTTPIYTSIAALLAAVGITLTAINPGETPGASHS